MAIKQKRIALFHHEQAVVISNNLLPENLMKSKKVCDSAENSSQKFFEEARKFRR